MDDKVFEFESAVAVKNAIGGTAHIHSNAVFMDQSDPPKTAMEVGAVLHEGDESLPNSVAYHLVEASYSPQPGEVEVLEQKASKFMILAKFHPHYRTVTTVIPVLAGRHWTEETIRAASHAKLWRVQPSGLGYQIIRSLHYFVRKRVPK